MRREPYTAGPWPGLTPRGAGVLLGCAAVLGIALAAFGPPRQPVPDIPVMAALSIVPLALATRLVRTPGVASAVCGAYLLPRALLSLIDPRLELPPLLLVPAFAFDLAVWLRPADIAALKNVWPARTPGWRTRNRGRRGERSITARRAMLAGGLFGAVLSTVEPPFAVLLGADPSVWTASSTWPAMAAAALACAALSLIARDKEC